MLVSDLYRLRVRVDVDSRAMGSVVGLWEGAGDEIGGIGAEGEEWLHSMC